MQKISTVLQTSTPYSSLPSLPNVQIVIPLQGLMVLSVKRLMASRGERESDGILREMLFLFCPSIQ